ncbi:uncharacterized protein [Rutidosis leptorrhynchoides]|uniref:uncharacterized protein n=1 Tax=Rutidosis leptorrhynchoides TaxID=125765 RepID=UPI003A996077
MVVATLFDLEVENILLHQIVRRRGVPSYNEYLVKWRNLPDSEASWEAGDLLRQFPDKIKKYHEDGMMRTSREYEHCNYTFTQQEIVSLYQRFCQLDRNSGGFISADEFLSVPEFAVNSFSQRLFRMIDGLNFKEFLAFLSAFSSQDTLQHKVNFKVFRFDGNGKVAFSDLLDVLRDLTGQFIFEQQREIVLTQVLEEAGYKKDSLLGLSVFMKVMSYSGLKMEVEVPVD